MLNEYSFEDIYIRHAADACPNSDSFTMHIHEQCEIYFYLCGEVDYMVEGSRYSLSEKSILIMRPAEAHSPKFVGQSTYERYAINFPLDFASDFDPDFRLTKAFTDRPLGVQNLLTFSAAELSSIQELFDQMFYDYADEYDRNLAIKTNLLKILTYISRAFRQTTVTKKEENSNLEQIVAYVNRHLFEQLSVPAIARHFYISPSHFNRLFRQATGASPWEYIKKKRLTAAKEKIRSGEAAQAASRSCGFQDYSAFYRSYTKYFGCAPTASGI